MIDELKKQKLKNDIRATLKRKNKYNKSIDILIEIYVDMIIQKEVIESKIKESTNSKSKEILSDALITLNEDIESYKASLLD